MNAGASRDAIHGYLTPESSCNSTYYYPLAANWPMGFSRSCAVAQETLLGIAATAGLDTSLAWAPDAPLPTSWNFGFALATDDLVLFSDRGRVAPLMLQSLFRVRSNTTVQSSTVTRTSMTRWIPAA